MSTIERERRVEFNDGMDELPSLDNDVENLCDVLEGGNPRTAAIMRRRYEKKGLMKAFPGEKTFTPPSALGLQPPLQRLAPLPRPEPAPLPVEQPIVPNKLEQKVFQASMETPERKSFERKSFERKSWADMSTDSEDESPENVESFASSDEGTVGTQLTWDPIGAEVSGGFTPTPEKGTFWLKVWLKMTGKSMEKHLSAQEPQPAPPMAPVARAPGAPGAPAMATPPEVMSPSDQGQGMTGYVPCQPTVMNAQRLPVLQAVQAVQAVPVQPMMMLFAPQLPPSPGTSFNFIPVTEAISLWMGVVPPGACEEFPLRAVGPIRARDPSSFSATKHPVLPHENGAVGTAFSRSTQLHQDQEQRSFVDRLHGPTLQLRCGSLLRAVRLGGVEQCGWCWHCLFVTVAMPTEYSEDHLHFCQPHWKDLHAC